MNIFKILSRGHGTIDETNISAFLYFILNPNETHGLHSEFLKEFIKPIVLNNKERYKYLLCEKTTELKDLSKNSQFSVEILIEKEVDVSSFSTTNETRNIDVVIEIYNKNKETPVYIFAIENKINDGASSDKEQLIDTQEGIKKHYKTEAVFALIYLTKDYSRISQDFYSNYINNKDYCNNSLHYTWENTDTKKEQSVFTMFQNIISKEYMGEMEPLHEYSKYTLKSFMNFIKSDFKSQKEEKIERNTISEEDYFNQNEVPRYIKDIHNLIQETDEFDLDKEKTKFTNLRITYYSKKLKEQFFAIYYDKNTVKKQGFVLRLISDDFIEIRKRLGSKLYSSYNTDDKMVSTCITTLDDFKNNYLNILKEHLQK